MKKLLMISAGALFLLVVSGGQQANAGTFFPVGHFKCYDVEDGKLDPKPVVDIVDQFEVDTAEVARPKMICNPASKDGSTVWNPFEHLVCYKIEGENKVKPQPLVEVDNQFGTQVLEVAKEGRLICVPSSKICLNCDPD